MADQQTDFTITDATTGATIGTGTLSFNQNLQVDGITGTFDGASISGPASFSGSDNTLTDRNIISGPGGTEYNYGVDMQGLAFSAGSMTYNIRETTTDNTYSHPIQTGDVIVSSAGQDEDVTFTTNLESNLNPCFTTGTVIETAKGAVAVERLGVGDLVTSTSGARPIRWIGHRTIDRPSHDQCPVRIRAGAFGVDSPTRDLLLSAGHPVLVGAKEDGEGGYLVPIMCLINGTSIVRAPVETVTYWHVELDAHDILLAEGLLAESYFDLGSRPWFGGADGALFDPDLALPGMPGRCRPVATDGPIVEAERRRLDAIFATRLATACAWPGERDLARD